MTYQNKIIKNIKQILRDRGLRQTDISQDPLLSDIIISRILKGQRKLTVDDISNFAQALEMREIDILTYPDVYIKEETASAEPVEVVLQIRLRKDTKDKVLKEVFKNKYDIEDLNK